MNIHLCINSLPPDLLLQAKTAINERSPNRSEAVSCRAEHTPHQLH